jgi:DNA excision repair protein ERCC-2
MFIYDSFRPGQLSLINSIQDAYTSKTPLFAQAPTGIGKTAASLYALVPLALSKKKTILFLTTRHTQHAIVVETLRKLSDQYPVSVCDFYSKRHMCIHEGIEGISQTEFLLYCKQLRDTGQCPYYLTAQSGVYSMPQGILSVQEFVDQCDTQGVCPFEVASVKAQDATVIICDYSYAFSPKIAHRFWKKIQKKPEDFMIICDEAHNLVERVKQMHSTTLSNVSIELAKKDALLLGSSDIVQFLSSIQEDFEQFSQTTYQEQRIDTSRYVVSDSLFEQMAVCRDAILTQKKRTALSSVFDFFERWQDTDKYCSTIKREGTKISLSHKKIDVQDELATSIGAFDFFLAMSATLEPQSYFAQLCGLQEYKSCKLQSPFDPAKRVDIIVPTITSLYKVRSAQMYIDYAKLIDDICAKSPKSTVVFFPSYSFLKQVSIHMQTQVIFEYAQQTKEEKKALIDSLKQKAVLLAVSGASFGEGIDLPGCLSCVIIVGIPLTTPSIETKTTIEYLQSLDLDGFQFAYTYPALCKITQNAGRAIRCESDYAVLVYIDERYEQEPYFSAIPSAVISHNPLKLIESFFTQHKRLGEESVNKSEQTHKK